MKNADKWFPIYIKIRDCNEDGFCVCPYCGGLIKWDLAVCCHFEKRGHKKLRYAEYNAHAGHSLCNQLDEQGEKGNYPKFMKQKYGKDIIEKLTREKNDSFKIMKHEYEEIGNFYKQKAKDLAKLKGIEI
jgi:hypothetical protein